MKRFCTLLLALAVVLPAFAQGHNTGTGGPDGDYASLAQRVLKLEKKTDAFNLYLNYAASFQESLGDWNSAFRAKQLRLEIKGTFGGRLSYRLRHRLNKAQGAMSEENFAKATDIMMVGWKFNEHWTIQGGKMCQYWGGFEFDENPMYIYQYSDLLDNMDNFLVGGALLYSPIPSQEFVLNITNSYSGKFADEYGANARTASGKALTAAKHPLSYLFNWNGNFWGDRIQTRWSIGAYTQCLQEDLSAPCYDVLVYLGQKLNLPKFQIYFDYMTNREQVDRMRIATGLLNAGEAGVYQTNVRYDAFITKLNWQFAPRFNLMGKYMYETASTQELPLFRRSMGWIGCLEYYPMKDQDFRVSLCYVGRNYSYTRESGLTGLNAMAHRIELGFMYRIKCY
ncbi:MAG: porin [Bacteroidales bacterium]|nr:porin [Bacteroidales bacterium]